VLVPAKRTRPPADMTHTLSYFDLDGSRGNPSRICLYAAQQAGKTEWIDNRVEGKVYTDGKAAGKWPTGLPELILPNGTAVSQSVAVTAYCGKLGGLYPEDPAQGLLVDAFMITCNDSLSGCPADPDPDVMKAKREEYANGTMKKLFNVLCDMIETGPFLLGDKISCADLVYHDFCAFMLRSGRFSYMPTDYPDGFPKLVALEKAVEASDLWVNYQAWKKANYKPLDPVTGLPQ